VHGTGRGGIETARLYEWGGSDRRGGNVFKEKRPGWALPIHALMVKAGVTIFFQGHDHLYACQELDGIIYQLVPQPAHLNWRTDHAAEYGYKEGQFLPSSGHVRVRVTADEATVEYVCAALPEFGQQGPRNGAVEATYTLRAQVTTEKKP
jgi:hypothetical protein